MRVLNENVLVVVEKKEGGLIIEDDEVRKGKVYLSGSDEVSKDEEVMFGEDFEEIALTGGFRAFLMPVKNVKLVY
jgi:hypothetical protein